jgi:hypothetical protein
MDLGSEPFKPIVRDILDYLINEILRELDLFDDVLGLDLIGSIKKIG